MPPQHHPPAGPISERRAGLSGGQAGQAGGRRAVRPLGHAARAVEPLADLHPAAGADQGQAHLMTVFQGAVDATFAAFGIDAVYTPAGGEPVRCGSSPGARTRSSASARPASTPRPRPSRCGRARSQARVPAISSPSAARPCHPGRAGTARSRSAGVDTRCATKLIDHGSLVRAEDIIGSEGKK